MTNDELANVIESIWEETLGSPIRRLPASEPLPERPHLITATVQIEGACPRTVLVACSDGLAREIAAVMFHVDPKTAALEDTQDALGEVVNILGGNVKAILPPPHSLSLPVVGERSSGIDLSTELVGAMGQARFEYKGEPLFVAVTVMA